MKNLVVILPAFEPDKRLVELVLRLREHVHAVIVVDDGSSSAGRVFNDLRAFDDIIVLVHPANRGKGAALKTGFAEVLRRFPTATGVVTADADGQHLPEDILRVAKSLAEHPDHLSLGTRTFGAGTPFRSLLGNFWTIAEFRLLTGSIVHDTQSGLRGIPINLLPTLLEIPGERYDYEIRMLVRAAKRPGKILEVPIHTVYEQGNARSHFRPFADTLNTQRALFSEIRRSTRWIN